MNSSDQQSYYKQKIKAFLHELPEKPLILELGENHEASTQEYLRILLDKDESFDKSEWEFTDHVASAADRASFPMDNSQFKVNFRTSPIITHPNSGSQFNLEEFFQVGTDDLKKNIVHVLEDIRDLSGGDTQKMYLYLWRCFAEMATETEKGNNSLDLLWNYLPADTRIPDHSIIDHARIVSAFAGAGIKKESIDGSLLLFTIGPVQEFIAAARKTKDLWAGSYMLSWLTWQGMKVFCEELGPDSILFPDMKGQPLVDYWLKYEKDLNLEFEEKDLAAPTLPNRFFAVVPKNRVEELAEKAQNAIVKALLNVGNFAFEKLKPVLPGDTPDFDVWEKQVSNFVQCYWASLDLPNWRKGEENLNHKFKELFSDFFLMDEMANGSKRAVREAIYDAYEKGGFKPNIGTFYGRFYEIVEKALGGRKSLRDFNELTEHGYRCSLIPGLAALAPNGENIKTGDYDKFWRTFYSNIQKSNTNLTAQLGKNERLSPLALTKRLFPHYLNQMALSEARGFNSKHFNSTHALAVADFKYQIIRLLLEGKNLRIEEKLQDYNTAAHAFFDNLSLDTESPLLKIGRLAEEASINSKINTISFSSLPGELFQLDYYDENYIDDLKFPDHYKNDEKKRIHNKAKVAKDALRNLIEESGLRHPSKYYAIIYLDGDNMGKWLSGDNAPEFWKVLHPEAVESLASGIEDSNLMKHDLYQGWANIFENNNGILKRGESDDNRYSSKVRPQAPTQHMAISRALNNYSLKIVRKIVEEEFLGRLIYAGGDDVVAMVSLHDALPCTEKLRAAFSGHLKSPGEENVTIDNLKVTLRQDESNGYITYQDKGRAKIASTLGPTATASCGIVTAHYMYPLKQALSDARKAEKFAKNELGRNAFAVNIVKRSGEMSLSGAKWIITDDMLGSRQVVANGVLKQFANVIFEQKLSPKFIVDIEEVIDVLVALPQSAILSEIKRLYNQHNAGFGDSKWREEGESEESFESRVSREKKDFFEETIKMIFANCDKLGNDDKTKSKDYCQKPSEKGKPAEWVNLRNAVKLLDMAYYIGKGGGR